MCQLIPVILKITSQTIEEIAIAPIHLFDKYESCKFLFSFGSI